MGLVQTYLTIMSVNAAISCNNLIYYLRKIPLIKRIVPESLYAACGGKDAIKVIALVLGFIKSIFFSGLYLAFFFYGPLSFTASKNIKLDAEAYRNTCVMIFFFLNILLGGYLMHKIKASSHDTSMVLLRYLRLNPRNYYISRAIVEYIRKSLTMIIPMVIAGLLIGLGPVRVIVLLVGMISVRIFIDGLELLPFNMRIYDSTVPRVIKYSIVTILCLAAAYAQILYMPIAELEHVVAPYIVSPLAIPVYLIIAVLGVFLIRRFADYKELVRLELNELETVIEMKEGAGAKAMVLKEDDLDMHENRNASKKTGYAYLDAMFLQRYRKLFFKRTVRLAVISFFAPIALALVDAFRLFYGAGHIYTMTIKALGIWIFIIYFVAFKENYTRALFNNMDKYLLCYRWYRKPDAILSNYFIRLKSSFLMNSLITMPLIIGVLIGGAIASTSAEVLLMFAVMVAVLTLFYSVHYLTLYYLLQPYTDQSKVKSPIYLLFNTLIYMFSFVMMQNRSIPMWLYIAICAVVIIYLIVSVSLLKRLAPRTFKRKE